MDAELFEARLRDRRVAHDLRVLADFVRIYCDGHHSTATRRPAKTAVAEAGLYRRKRPVLCEECEAHLGYGEQRRVSCPKEPKPFCSYCDTHCYRPSEAQWQREMMRYSGRRSWRHGHAIDGIRHVLQGRAMRRTMLRGATVTAATDREEVTR